MTGHPRPQQITRRNTLQEKHLSQVIRQRLEAGKVRYWAGDNVSTINTMLHKGSNISKLTSV
jgi:hypothetical protein